MYENSVISVDIDNFCRNYLLYTKHAPPTLKVQLLAKSSSSAILFLSSRSNRRSFRRLPSSQSRCTTPLLPGEQLLPLLLLHAASLFKLRLSPPRMPPPSPPPPVTLLFSSSTLPRHKLPTISAQLPRLDPFEQRWEFGWKVHFSISLSSRNASLRALLAG